MRLVLSFLLVAVIAGTKASGQTPAPQRPCLALTRANAVFVGTTGPMVARWDRLNGPDDPPIEGRYMAVNVERAYRGVTTPVVYLTPAGIDRFPQSGRRYLFYGWDYHADIFMVSATGEGWRPIEAAGEELAWLNTLAWNGSDGVGVNGTLTYKDASTGSSRDGTPLDGVPLRLSGGGVERETATDSKGRFSFPDLPAGEYAVTPALPDHVTLWNETDHRVNVLDGGCAEMTLVARWNGRLSGRVTNQDGSPAAIGSVDVEPVDVAPDQVGHVRGRGSVSVDHDGRFQFSRLAPGRYLLGVNIYSLKSEQAGVTYYPGTSDRRLAVPVAVGQGTTHDGFDFSVRPLPPTGIVWVRARSASSGVLTVCTEHLDRAVRGWSRVEVTPSQPIRVDVREGWHYAIHAHVETAGGTLTSAPVAFTGATGQASIELQPDRPRRLH